MELEITSKKENPLLNRVEVNFLAVHPKEKTPKRDDVRLRIAEELNLKKNFIIIDNMKSIFGCPETTGYAKIYPSQKEAEKYERDYLITRNTGGKK